MNKKEQLACSLLDAKGFLIEEETNIDGIIYPCRPIYIEYIYLYPSILKKVGHIVANKLKSINTTLIISMESAVLPLSSYISSILEIPFSVIRKPNHKGHEKNEPKIFMDDEFTESELLNCVFFDDAIWSGKSTVDAFDIAKTKNFIITNLIYLIDFFEFSAVEYKIPKLYKDKIEKRYSFLKYEELLKFAFQNGYINNETYKNSLLLKNDTNCMPL